MQYNILAYLKKTSIRTYLNVVIKTFILAFATIYIFNKLDEGDLIISMGIFSRIWDQHDTLSLLLPFILIPLNWGLEVVKWQFLAKKVQNLTFFQALRGVLGGVTMGFITPHGLGDYLGRIWAVEKGRRLELAPAIFLGRAAQFLITLTFGMAGLIYFFHHQNPGWSKNFTAMIFGLLASSWILIGIGFSFRKRVVAYLKRSIFPSAGTLLNVLYEYSRQEIHTVILYSGIRYLVFSFQFYWLLILFGVDLPTLVILTGITWVFLFKSIIPSFNFLSDLGTREFSAILFFSYYPVDLALIINASICLWFLNLVLPSLAGIFFIGQFRILTSS